MQKLKRYFLHILLSIIAVFCFGFGTAFLNNESVSVSAATTFIETETTVIVRCYADNRVMLNIAADSEFNSVSANTKYTADKLGDLNTLDYVFVNGKSMRDLGVSSFFINLYNEAAFAFEGVTLSKYDTVTIKQGAQFPTKAYLSDGTATCYTALADSSWTHDETTYGVQHETFTETTTTVTGITEYTTNGHLGFVLSTSDYTTTGTQNAPLSKLATMNLLSSVTYNGVNLGASLTTSGDPNVYLAMWTRWNQIYFPLANPTVGDIITISAGTQFPSSAYITDSSNKTCYVVKQGVSFTYDGTQWTGKTIQTEEETSVTAIHLRNTNRLLFFLSAHDYQSVGGTIQSTTYAEYNTLEKIQIYVGDTCVTLKEALALSDSVYYNVWGETGSISYPLDSAKYTSSTVTKVVIPTGTEFPSYSGNVAYTTTKTQTFINGTPAETDATNWVEQIRFSETKISKMEWVSNVRLMVSLSPNDYGTATENWVNKNVSAEQLSKLNTLDYIMIDGKTLRELGITTADLNYWTYWGRFSVALSAQPGKVVFKAGTQFPSMGYVKDGGADCYVLKEAIAYQYDGSAWSETTVEDPIADIDTNVTKVLYDNSRLGFELSACDYPNVHDENESVVVGNCNIGFTKEQTAELNFWQEITINGESLESLFKQDSCYLNMWANQNAVFVPIAEPAVGAVVTIPVGTQFPTYAMLKDGKDNCCVTTETVAYKKTASGWAEVLVFNEKPTSISEVKYNDKKEQTNNVLYFWLTESDYGTTDANIDISTCVKNLNTYEYIEIDGKKVEDMTMALGVQWINFFTRWGAFGLQLNTPYSWDKGPSYVYIKAGCQIPSLAYAKDNTVLSAYVIENDLWIVYDDYHDVWNILTQKPENLVKAGDTFPAYESVADRIFLGWELNGKLYKGGASAPEAGVANAVYLDYALEDGASVRMADTADESGIRFTAYLQEKSYNAYADYISSVGILLLPQELLGSESFAVGHSSHPLNFYMPQDKDYTFQNGVMTLRATIHTIRAANYNRDYAARVYVSVNYADGSTDYAYGYYQAENHVRNIYEVATAAHKAGEGTSQQRDVLVGYAGKIADLTFDGTTFAVTSGTIGSAVETIQTQSIEDSVVTLVIVSTIEPLLLVDGEPIRSDRILEKSFESNLFTVKFVYGTKSSLTYYASDTDMAKFFQDYFELYSMEGAYAVTHSGVANGWTYQQDWFMNGVAWFKATDFVKNDASATENATYSADGYSVYYFNNIDIDRNGNVYTYFNDSCPDTADNGPNYSTVTSYTLMPGQGWTLPNSECEGWESYHAEFNDSGVTDSALATELASYSSVDKDYEKSSGWTVNGSAVTQSNGVAAYTGTAKTGLTTANGATNAIVYEKTGISYSTYYAPFIELRLLLDDPDQVLTDYAIEWQIGDAWYSVTQSDYANNPYSLPAKSGMYRSYFPLYTHQNYGVGEVVYGNNTNGKTVTGLRVVLIAKDSTSQVTVGLDYVRATADSRHSTNGAKYIISLNEYASNHNDLDLLTQNITRARRAMLFQLEPLQGKNGLVNLSYLHRHDSYQGAPNGFWDIYPAGNLNTDANIYFYEALLALADMEEALAKNGISVTEMASIEWYDLAGVKQSATYNYTADSLRMLAETVKSKIQTTFYNSTTGRFAWSVYDVDSKGGNKAGSLMDYGFTELNLHAVEAGIATTEQETSIMSWISGTRTVSGDKVTGADIYEQPFAPVSTTKDNQKWRLNSQLLSMTESDFTAFYIDKAFGERCQDGGTIMHVSYYDILARAKTYGADDAYARIEEIQNWFTAVKAANEDATGWADFFKNYYTGTNDLQGGDTQGKYGLQDEFKEAIMVMATAPKIFLGLDAKYDTLTIAPNLGSKLTHFGMENLAFGENTYTCYATASSVTISDVKKNANSGLKVKLVLAYTAGQNVYLNGKLLDASAYTIENGYVIVTTDFANCTLQVK